MTEASHTFCSWLYGNGIMEPLIFYFLYFCTIECFLKEHLFISFLITKSNKNISTLKTIKAMKVLTPHQQNIF